MGADLGQTPFLQTPFLQDVSRTSAKLGQNWGLTPFFCQKRSAGSRINESEPAPMLRARESIFGRSFAK